MNYFSPEMKGSLPGRWPRRTASEPLAKGVSLGSHEEVQSDAPL